MFGSELVRAFEEVKDRFDPKGLLQSRQDRAARRNSTTAAYFRYAPGYRADDYRARARLVRPIPAPAAGSRARVEMCNNNGACRELAGGVMCPSYRVTRDERACDARPRQHAAPGAHRPARAPDALTSDAMARDAEALRLLQGCRRECPTGVDMARMKIEVLAARAKERGYSLRDRLVGISAALCRHCRDASRRSSICATKYRCWPR